MTWFSFQLPWFKATDKAESASVAQDPVVQGSVTQDPVAAPAQVTQVPALDIPTNKQDSGQSKPNLPYTLIDRTFGPHDGTVISVALSRDGRFFLSGAEDGKIRCWDAQTGDLRWKQEIGGKVLMLGYSEDARTILAANQDVAYVLNAEDHSITSKVSLPIKAGRISASADYRQLLLVPIKQDGNLPAVLFDAQDKKTIKTFQRDAGVSDGVVSPKGDIVVCGEYGLDIHNIRTGTSRKRTIFQDGYFEGMAISTDGKFLATGSGRLFRRPNIHELGNRLVRIWNLETGVEALRLVGHMAWIHSLAISPDNARILSAGGGTPTDYQGDHSGADTAVRLWGIDNKKAIWTGTGHKARVLCVGFSPDGKYAVSGSVDRTARVWRLPDPIIGPKIEGSKSSGSNQQIAEWVLARGGKVKISLNGGEPSEIQTKAQLPSGNFNVVEVDLKDLRNFGDQDLQRLNQLKNLSVLTVMGTNVTDAGLRELADVTSLTLLNVAGTSVNGSGFQHLSNMNKLDTLLCGGAPINDANLVHLKKLPTLRLLGLIDTPITDAGMQTLASMQSLSELRLVGTKVTDKGVSHLKALKNLEKLSLERTGVTKKGVNAIRAALPKCEVKSD
jgi:WD40 repeat protein